MFRNLKGGARVLYTLISFDRQGRQLTKHAINAKNENHARKIAYVYRTGRNCREKKKIARTEVRPRYEIKCDYDRWHTQGLFQEVDMERWKEIKIGSISDLIDELKKLKE